MDPGKPMKEQWRGNITETGKERDHSRDDCVRDKRRPENVKNVLLMGNRG